jgi:hypothetical protein
VIFKIFGVLDVPIQEQVRVPLGDMSNQVQVRPNAGLLEIFLLDVDAQKRE